MGNAQRLCRGNELARIPEGDGGRKREQIAQQHHRSDPDRGSIGGTLLESLMVAGGH
jgi:hypothetical protein